MSELCDIKCEVCRVGAPALTDDEIAEYLPQVPEWKLVDHQGVKAIARVFKFKDFAEALAFTNQVGELAESEDHHPAILTEWAKVTVTFWTHKIRGLHKSDFVMAAKTDRLC